MAKKSYIVAGPTASGKSDFAHKLAKRVGGTVVNADSVQIYRGVENLSASPFAGMDAAKNNSEIDGVPYRLFSTKDLSEHISVTDYLALARAEFDTANIPVFVGGSGYYINSILKGLSPVPEVSLDNRARARKMVEEAPDAAKKLTDYEFKDPQRIARALEVFLETGRQLTEWQQLPRRGAIRPAPFKILLMPPREALDERIRARLDVMITGGLDEARANAGFSNRAIGIEMLGKFLSGELTEIEARNVWAERTCQYAKKQRTWFRNQFDPDFVIPRFPTDQDLENVLGQ